MGGSGWHYKKSTIHFHRLLLTHCVILSFQIMLRKWSQNHMLELLYFTSVWEHTKITFKVENRVRVAGHDDWFRRQCKRSRNIFNTLLNQNSNTSELQDSCTCQKNEVKAQKIIRFWSQRTVKTLDHSPSQNVAAIHICLWSTYEKCLNMQTVEEENNLIKQ